MLKSKKTNRWTEETAEMPKKDIISVECFFLVSLGTAPVSVCVCVCVHHEFTILHIILPLFTRGHQRSDWSSPLFQVLWEEEEEEGGGGRDCGQSPLSLPVSCRPHEHDSVGRKAGNKNTHCSPLIRHQVVTWPR